VVFCALVETQPIVNAFALAGFSLFLFALAMGRALITDQDSEKAKQLIWRASRVISALLAIFLTGYVAWSLFHWMARVFGL
jgi:hypothetical protein